MTLLDVATYQRFTHDLTTNTSSATGALVDAQAYIEDELRRPLESMVRTEDCYVEWGGIVPNNGRVYPKAWPITDTSSLDTAGYSLLLPDNGDDNTILVEAQSSNVGDMPGPFYGLGYNPDYRTLLTITYTGGYTLATLPVTLARAIAEAAFTLTRVPDSAVPIGAVNVAVGDVRVGFGPNGAQSPIQGSLITDYTRKKIKRYAARWV